jgi:hypothetical protein
MNRRIKIAEALSLLVLTACTNPRNSTLPPDLGRMDESTKSVILQLSPEERSLLARYMVRPAPRDDMYSTGPVTIGQAIQEQKESESSRAQRERQVAAVGSIGR